MKKAAHYFWIFSNFYGKVFGRSWLAGIHHIFLNLSLHGLGYDNGHRLKDTGEQWFIRNILKKNQIRVCLDVGANIGSYSQELLTQLDCVVYAMEPAPSSFAELQKLADVFPKRIFLIQKAIADFEGTAPLFSKGPRAGTATLSKEVLNDAATESVVNVTTLDTLTKSLGLEKVDFIKIDTEGYEKEVIRGMKEMLSMYKPKFIQFEFNILQLYRNYTLLELTSMLEGYEFYRLLPNGWIKIDPRKFANNIFMFCNIVAKRT